MSNFYYYIEPNGYGYYSLNDARAELRRRLNKDTNTTSLYCNIYDFNKAIKRRTIKSIKWLPAR